MSADNWASCPQCKKKSDDQNAKLVKDAEKSYGKVAPEKYIEMLDASKTPPALHDTLREDYEIGVDAYGVFRMSYGCSCEECGFEFSHKIEIVAIDSGRRAK